MTNISEENKIADTLSSKTIFVSSISFFILCIFAAGGYYLWQNIKSDGHSRTQIRSTTNLKMIGLGLMMYAVDYDEQMPPNLEMLVTGNYLEDTAVFLHPQRNYRPDIIEGKLDIPPDYVIFLDFPADMGSRPKYQIRGYEKTEFAENGQVAVLFYDCATTFMSIADLNAQLKAEGRGPAE